MPDADMEMTTRILADSAFGCAGQRCLAVSVTVAEEGDRCVVTVSDEGPGVPTVDLERIFERHFSQRPALASIDGTAVKQQTTHTGIGLWIVRRNVEAIGGRVQAENAPARGLIMRVQVPLAA